MHGTYISLFTQQVKYHFDYKFMVYNYKNLFENADVKLNCLDTQPILIIQVLWSLVVFPDTNQLHQLNNPAVQD